MEVPLSAAKSRILMFVFVMRVRDVSGHTHTTVTGEQKVLNKGEWRNREGK